jgi:hypothetical protein
VASQPDIWSFRTAKALKQNPGSIFDIPTLKWHNSAAFEWQSRQLLNLELMELGHWFQYKSKFVD